MPKGDGERPVDKPLLEVNDLRTYYPVRRGTVLRNTVGHLRAVDGVSFSLHPGETLGVVGESGCGKSTLARTIVRLERPTSGTVCYQGRDVSQMSRRDLRAYRRDVQMVFQDPWASLDPRMTVGGLVGEAWHIHSGTVPRARRRERTQELLELVGLSPDHIDRYPHQFSGGQRQRIGVARALALDPALLVCDEPVSALDVSVQAEILNLFQRLQRELGLALVFIAHDLSVVRHISHRVAVMYLGKIVELGDESDIYERPTHPYTQALLSAAPIPDPHQRVSPHERILLKGEVPSPADPPSGCNFRTRCFKARSECADEEPALVDRFGHGHPSACLFAELSAVSGSSHRR